jgi:hypothetical protein
MKYEAVVVLDELLAELLFGYKESDRLLLHYKGLPIYEVLLNQKAKNVSRF